MTVYLTEIKKEEIKTACSLLLGKNKPTTQNLTEVTGLMVAAFLV